MTHRDITSSDRGILEELLTRSYQPLRDLNEPPWIPGEGMWQDYDDRIFDNLVKTDECVFLTESNYTVVGFASFTRKESEATIGRNSVLPEHGGKGIGSGQVAEIIRRCIALNLTTIHVMTGTHRFFNPAQRMYLKAGFREISRDDDGQGVGRILVRYRLDH
jgi:GNAT superfamily N-acetyltransferase